jgi:uncharacterized protein YbbC (DUF1343 family)
MGKKSIVLCLLGSFSLISAQSERFKLGIENISSKEFRLLKSGPIGLIANQTSITGRGKPSVDLLVDAGCSVAYLFAPEHGAKGVVAAEKAIDNAVDEVHNIPIISLYGPGAENRLQDALQHITIICYDIQDSGMRYFTYISTLFRAMEQAVKHRKKFVVFDRPNPLGGSMEGPLVEDELLSFISIAPIPLRHGMTVGELARFFNQSIFDNKLDLHVVPMKNYHRDKPFLLSTFLSPNIQTTRACKGYSFLGLLGEVRPFDVCVGSDDAFQCMMLPKNTALPENFWQNVAEQLSEHGIYAEPFERMSERKKVRMVGLKIIHDEDAIQAFPAFLTAMHAAHNAGVKISFSPSFDKAAGASWVRTSIIKKVAIQELLQKSRNDLKTFRKYAQRSFLYKPFPRIV